MIKINKKDIINIISEQMGILPKDINLDADLVEDYKFNSITINKLLFTIKNQLNIKANLDIGLNEIKTFQQFITRLLNVSEQ